MARPHRLQCPVAIHHVTVRGGERRPEPPREQGDTEVMSISMHRPPRGHRLAFLCLTLFLFVSRVVADRAVVDFEDPGLDALFTVTGQPAASVSAEQVSQGRRALKMVFERYEAGAPQWPGVWFGLDEVGAPGDWREYASLSADVYCPDAEGGVLRFIVKSGAEGEREWFTREQIPGSAWRTVTFALTDLSGAVDLGAVTRMGLYMTRPERPTTFFVDNIRLVPWDLADPSGVEAMVLSPSFNHAFYASRPEGNVSLRYTRRAPAELFRDVVFRLTLRGADGSPLGRCESGLEPDAIAVTLTLPKPQLADGERISAEGQVIRGERVLRTDAFTFRQAPAAADEVTLRDDGVTLVNGRPFFPFGMYQSPVSEFPTLKRMGFNTVHTYVPADAAYMQAAEEAGLRVITAVKGIGGRPPHYHEPEWTESTVVDHIRSVMGSPALLAYYMFDEPSPGRTPPEKLGRLCAIPRRIDPHHLVAGCNNGHQFAYRRVPDAMMVDAYPVPGKMTNLIERMREGVRAQHPNRAAWFIPQAFPWEPYCRTRTTDASGRPELSGGRLPTFDEVRTMPWLALAIGAKGLIYYSWQVQGVYIREAYPVFWRAFEYHVAELQALFPWLLERPPGQAPTSNDPGVFVTARQRGDHLLIAASNSRLEPAETEFSVPGLGARRLWEVSGEGGLDPVHGAVPLTLAPVETRVFTTDQGSVPELPTLGEIRRELAGLGRAFAEENPSVCTYAQGATLRASWGFPVPPEVRWASWYRMIDGWPGTPWVVGTAFRSHGLKGWRDKDFASPGRWIEVTFRGPTDIDTVRAIASPWAKFRVEVRNGETWRRVEAKAVPDRSRRHHSHASATTTARFERTRADGFRIVFTEPRGRPEVVFELSAAGA